MKKVKTLEETHQDVAKKEFNEYLFSSLSPREQERYTIIPDLEGPIKFRSGKILYWDQKEGKYYDRDTDTYLSHDEFRLYSESNLAFENVNSGYSEHLQQLVRDIRAETRDNMVIHILGEFGAMMAERGYERAKKDFGVE